jgi:hypothetical protein
MTECGSYKKKAETKPKPIGMPKTEKKGKKKKGKKK